MSVTLRVGESSHPLGSDDFLNAFFATVATRIESGQWGSRFPVVMLDLYAGRLAVDQLSKALTELDLISEELARHPPHEIVWDADDLSRQPPWGTEISDRILNLADYFVTSEGRQLVGVLREGLSAGLEASQEVRIEV